MSPELSAVVGFMVGALGALTAVPIAIRIAHKTGFYDVPREYRRHRKPTPMLGGAALLFGWIVAAVAVGAHGTRMLVVLGCGVGLWALGTVDDRVAVAPRWRLLAELVAAVALVLAGAGWHTAAPGVVNVALTVFWVVGLVNAFNLMDNMDGSCATVTIVAASGAGMIAALEGRPVIAGLAFGLAGSAAGFLRWNLARPARLFLGDGGSMLAGFLVAALVMGVARRSADGNAGLLLGALLVGVPMLDVTLVSISRWRRGVTLTTGGVDHLTHRIALVRRSPRAVAVTLALVQLFLCGLAVAGHELGPGVLAGLAFAAFVSGVAAIVVLDTPRWRPSGIAVGTPRPVSAQRRRGLASTQGEQP